MSPLLRAPTAVLLGGALLAPLAVSVAATEAMAAPPTSAVSTTAGAGVLPADATLDQLRAATESIIGPTTDAFGELAVFTPLQPGVPTPPDAFLSAFVISLDQTDEGVESSGSVELVHTMPADDVTALYLDAFAALGMTMSSDTMEANDTGTSRTVEFDSPAAATPTVWRLDILDGDEDTVTLYFDGPVAADVLAIFGGWSTMFPLPPGGVLSRAQLSSSGFDRGNVRTTFDYATDDQAGLAAQIVAGLPANGLTHDAGLSDETSVVMESDAGVNGLTYADAFVTQPEAGVSWVSVSGTFDADLPEPPSPPVADPAATTTADPVG